MQIIRPVFFTQSTGNPRCNPIQGIRCTNGFEQWGECVRVVLICFVPFAYLNSFLPSANLNDQPDTVAFWLFRLLFYFFLFSAWRVADKPFGRGGTIAILLPRLLPGKVCPVSTERGDKYLKRERK